MPVKRVFPSEHIFHSTIVVKIFGGGAGVMASFFLLLPYVSTW